MKICSALKISLIFFIRFESETIEVTEVVNLLLDDQEATSGYDADSISDIIKDPSSISIQKI